MGSAKGTSIYEKYANMAKGYDVVTCYIVDDCMYDRTFSFFNMKLTDIALSNCLFVLAAECGYASEDFVKTFMTL